MPARKETADNGPDAARRTCYICNNCIDVCPNRANIGFVCDGVKIGLHLDALCNACGNCADFCPKGYVPYKDKLTIFSDAGPMRDSDNEGFALLDGDQKRFMVRMDGITTQTAGGIVTGQEQLDKMLETVLDENPYLLDANRRAPRKD
jgi:putative selenate reductase